MQLLLTRNLTRPSHSTFRQLASFSYNLPAAFGTPQTHLPCGINYKLVASR